MLERVARQAHLHERADDVGGFGFRQHDHVARMGPVHDLADGGEFVQLWKRQPDDQKTRVGIGFKISTRRPTPRPSPSDRVFCLPVLPTVLIAARIALSVRLAIAASECFLLGVVVHRLVGSV